MRPNNPDRIVPREHPPQWLLLMLGAVLIAATLAGGARAQNYPWCSNFADGAGTNCGFATEEQCRITILGSGGYCDRNNLYKPAAAAPAHGKRKRRADKHS